MSDDLVLTKKKGFVRAGKVLIKEGTWSDDLYWLKSGEMEATVVKDGMVEVVRSFGPGDLLGELSFLDQRPRSATIKAKTDCELIRLHREDFEKMLDELNPWMKKIIQVMIDKIRQDSV